MLPPMIWKHFRYGREGVNSAGQRNCDLHLAYEGPYDHVCERDRPRVLRTVANAVADCRRA